MRRKADQIVVVPTSPVKILCPTLILGGKLSAMALYGSHCGVRGWENSEDSSLSQKCLSINQNSSHVHFVGTPTISAKNFVPCPAKQFVESGFAGDFQEYSVVVPTSPLIQVTPHPDLGWEAQRNGSLRIALRGEVVGGIERFFSITKISSYQSKFSFQNFVGAPTCS
ncbi:hypothetical protein AB3N59_11160 [Leptospira sp. WS92.C1]